jgi:hypothetical protein
MFGYRNYIVRQKPRRRPRKPDPKRWANQPENIWTVVAGWTAFSALVLVVVLVAVLR